MAEVQDDLSAQFESLSVSSDLVNRSYCKKIKPIVESELSDHRKREEGESEYSSWKLNGYKWNYGLEGFRAVYTQRFFETRAYLVKTALKDPKINEKIPIDFLRNIKMVASFGCGPGPEMIGFQDYIEETLKLDATNLTMIGYDTEAKWSQYVTCLGHNFKFEQKDLMDFHVLESLPEMDVVIVSYFAASVNFSWNFNHRWEIVIAKYKMVVVIDMQNFDSQNRGLEQLGFIGLQLQDRNNRGVQVHVYFKNQNLQDE